LSNEPFSASKERLLTSSKISQGLEYVFSFVWKPPILIAWKPRADLDREAMDPARDTVVSTLYKSFGGATDKTAIYDEEDQLLIISEM